MAIASGDFAKTVRAEVCTPQFAATSHLGLAKDTPAGRPTEIRSEREKKIQSFPRLGGLHHRYAVAA